MKFISTETKGHVLLIGLNRPDKMNAFNLQMLDELADAYTQLENDSQLRCAVVFANGKHFTGGLDLGEVGPYAQKGNPIFSVDKVDPSQTYGLRRSKPVVLAVDGYCLTIGIELILAADICIAGPNAKFGQIEIKRGIFPFCGATLRFHQRCGWGNAMRYLLTGDIFDAKEAYRIGLVQELTEDHPKERAIELAETIAAQAPLGVMDTIFHARLTLLDGENASLPELLPTAEKLMKTEDAKEGLQSFLERRAANFKGQ